MKLTLSQAAKEVGMNKATLSRWRKSGRFSAEKKPDGSYLIDASELDRIKELKQSKRRSIGNATPQVQQLVTHPNNDETRVLEAKLEALQQLLNREQEASNDIRQDRDYWRQQATALLTHQKKEQKPAQGRLRRAWAVLTGRDYAA